LTTFICCGCAYGCVPTTLWLLMPTKLLEFCQESGLLQGDKLWWNAVIEAVHPTHSHLTSMLYIYKVFDNLYMLWMCIWMCFHHVMVAHADLPFGILSGIRATPRRLLMVKCGACGCTPNPYSSHINVIYIKGVWQPLYAVDAHMDMSPPCYGCSCRPSFWNFVRILGYSKAMSDGEMQWLRLYTQPIFISHQWYIYIRCLTNFICCGCAYGCVPTT